MFTVKTQHFNVSSLNELTEERFNKAIKDLEERNEWERKLIHLAFTNDTK